MSADPRYTLFAARAVFDERLTAMDVRVLAALGTFTDRQGWCYPSQTTIAKRLGTSRTRVNGCIKALVDVGYVQAVKQARDSGAQTVSLYRVLMDLSAPDAVVDAASTGEIIALWPVSNTDTPLSAGETGRNVGGAQVSSTQDVDPPVSEQDTPCPTGETPPCPTGETPPCQPMRHRTNPSKEHSQSKPRATRLPATWAPRSEEISFGIAGGLSEPEVRAAAEHMRDWAASSPKAVKLDWDRTFRNWLRTTVSDAKRGRRPVVSTGFDRTAALRIFQEHGYRHPQLTDDDLKQGSAP